MQMRSFNSPPLATGSLSRTQTDVGDENQIKMGAISRDVSKILRYDATRCYLSTNYVANRS